MNKSLALDWGRVTINAYKSEGKNVPSYVYERQLEIAYQLIDLLKNKGFDIHTYLRREVFANMSEEDREDWCLEEAQDIASDIRCFGIKTDAEEVYEIISGYIAQDKEGE